MGNKASQGEAEDEEVPVPPPMAPIAIPNTAESEGVSMDHLETSQFHQNEY